VFAYFIVKKDLYKHSS